MKRNKSKRPEPLRQDISLEYMNRRIQEEKDSSFRDGVWASILFIIVGIGAISILYGIVYVMVQHACAR